MLGPPHTLPSNPRTRPQGWCHRQPSPRQDTVQSHSDAPGTGSRRSRLGVRTPGWLRKALGVLFCFFLYRFPGSLPTPRNVRIRRPGVGPRTCTFAWFSGALQCHRKGWPGQELLIWGAHWFTNEGTGGPRRKVCVALPLAGHSRSRRVYSSGTVSRKPLQFHGFAR